MELNLEDMSLENDVARILAKVLSKYPNSRYRSCALTHLELFGMYLEKAPLTCASPDCCRDKPHSDRHLVRDESGHIVATT